MAELTLKMASQLIGYTNADIKIPVPDDITPEAVARLHWDWNMRFLLEQEKVANEPVPEKQEAAITKAATDTLDAKLPVTVESEEKTTDYKVGDTVNVGGIEFTKHSEAPWEAPPKAEAKPWESKPKFDLF